MEIREAPKVKKYRLVWKDKSAAKRYFGPFAFNVSTGESVSLFIRNDPRLRAVFNNPKYNELFNFVQEEVPAYAVVVPARDLIPEAQKKINEESYKKREQEFIEAKAKEIKASMSDGAAFYEGTPWEEGEAFEDPKVKTIEEKPKKKRRGRKQRESE